MTSSSGCLLSCAMIWRRYETASTRAKRSCLLFGGGRYMIKIKAIHAAQQRHFQFFLDNAKSKNGLLKKQDTFQQTQFYSATLLLGLQNAAAAAAASC